MGADAYLAYGAYGLGYGHAYGYAGYPYAAHSVYYGKREAEAEPKADAYLGYSLGCAGYGLGHYGYAGYPYAHTGYVYGKREAEAEPEAYGYGYRTYGYGYARPYSYGYGRGYYWG